MPKVQRRLCRFDEASAGALDWLAARPRAASAVLLILTLVCFLPGVVALPPVDRTEIVYAATSRAMLARGDLLDAQLQGERFPYRPIGAFWLQMATASALGADARDAITTYRLPSLAGAILAVLATYWLLVPLLGGHGALIAAGLFGITVPVAVQAQLAISEGPVLPAAVVAQLALLRIYAAKGDEHTRGLAVLFWTAQGLGVLLNALAVPILSVSTLAALLAFDRSLAWLKRLRPMAGLPLMLLVGAPWLLVRAHVDGGVPFAGLSWSELLAALGGSQAMKFKAAPLSFTLVFVLGFLPGALLLYPALKGLWRTRSEAVPRFLLAWIIGYLAYLELISSKPALYTVQALFPAAAAAVALALLAGDPTNRRLSWPARAPIAPPVLIGAGIAALYAGVLWSLGEGPSPGMAIAILAIASLLSASASAGRLRLPHAWLMLGVPGFAAFLGFTFGVFLPSLAKPWPAPRLANAVEPLRSCVDGPVGMVGFREPSATFVLGEGVSDQNAERLANWAAEKRPGIAIVEARWHDAFLEALAARGAELPYRVGCVEAFNVMRGCQLDFAIYVTGDAATAAGCAVATTHACKAPPRAASVGQPRSSRCH
jgi:4-amino-4-deoxy-L-arabinose transferase-like glycosyltransferase